MRKNSKTPEILRLHDEGVPHAEIARIVGCTPPNVLFTVRRHRAAQFKMPAPPESDLKWLRGMARRLGVMPEILARAVLVHAISHAREMHVVPDAADLEIVHRAMEAQTQHD